MDRRIRAITADAAIQITAVETTGMVERARNIHKTLPLATAALGRTLTITSIMGSQLKVDDGSVTVQVRGDGPLGTIVCVSDSEGYARGYLQNPAVDLPLRADGKLNVGVGVGYGQLMVIKDIGLKEPVSGMVNLVNGEIAEDVTRYFAESEQIPSACALGVLVNTDQSVRQAGGYLVQLMPGACDTDIDDHRPVFDHICRDEFGLSERRDDNVRFTDHLLQIFGAAVAHRNGAVPTFLREQVCDRTADYVAAADNDAVLA